MAARKLLLLGCAAVCLGFSLPARGRAGLCVASRPTLSSELAPLRLQLGGPPRIVLIWYSPAPFVYENSFGGADLAPLGRSTARFSTLAQALALGRKLEAASKGITYSVYKLGDGEMELKGSYPKRINAEGAKVKFRRRKPKTGGAEDRILGVGGMGDDVWYALTRPLTHVFPSVCTQVYLAFSIPRSELLVAISLPGESSLRRRGGMRSMRLGPNCGKSLSWGGKSR